MADTHSVLWTLDHIRLDGDLRPRLEVDRLEIAAGRTAVLGASGAGKTSLLNLLIGFERPGQGQLDSSLETQAQRLPLFWIPPDGGLWPQASALDHLRAVLPRGSDDRRAPSLLSRFGLQQRQHATPGQLSAGEQSRLAVARGLAADASVLVADEPLVHVDPARRDEDWETLVQETRTRNTSLVFSTHAPEQVLRHADRVVVLARGRVIAAGEVASLYARPPSREVAESLGPVNWFEPEQADAWGIPAPAPAPAPSPSPSHLRAVGLRPEQILFELDPSGPLRVLDSRAIGPLGETTLECLADDSQRRIRHLADAAGPATGQRLRIGIRGPDGTDD